MLTREDLSIILSITNSRNDIHEARVISAVQSRVNIQFRPFILNKNSDFHVVQLVKSVKTSPLKY